MHYVKKMCVLRQLKQGFSGDGKALSGLVKAEQYGQNVAVEVSIINFAPLSDGEYYCVVADRYGETELLPLRGKSFFNLVSKLDVTDGFCAVVCFVRQEIIPIAYGVNGQDYYDIHALIDGLERSPAPVKKEKREDFVAIGKQEPPKKTEDPTDNFCEEEVDYNDETLAKEDYYKKAYQWEKEDERKCLEETADNEQTQSATEKEGADGRFDFEEDENCEDVLHPFKTDGDGYYLSIKEELDALFEKYPKDDTLKGAFDSSEWARLKGEEGASEYLVGVVYKDLTPLYICYAILGTAGCPPEEIKEESVFIPHTLFDEDAGYFVIFQSAATGECIKPEKL